jgi:hypothetical protein
MHMSTRAAGWSVLIEGTTTVGQPGTAIIRAMIGAVSGSSTITVTDATLVSVAVMPAQLQCLRGVVTQLHAIGRFSDLTTLDITEDMSWTSSSFLVASVRTDQGRRGETRCVAIGDATISATRGALHGECQLSVSLIGSRTSRSIPTAPP